MHLSAPAIVLSVLSHGESGAVVRALTRSDGLQAGYVRGGRSRALRPALQPGNTILGEWRARTADQLPALTLELVTTLAPLHVEPLAAAAIAWSTALTVAVLPEAQAYPRVHDALAGLLGAIGVAPSARGWAAALARYELLLLAELGFGLDLDHCVVTGTMQDLVYVSPTSGGAVSRDAAEGYQSRLLPLPPFLRAGGEASWTDIFAALAITGRFLARDLLIGRAAGVLPARERLVDRLKRAVA